MRRYLLVATILFVLTLAACSGKSSNKVNNMSTTLITVPAEYAGMKNPLSAESSAQGAGVFKNNCVSCHGEDGYGDGIASQALDPKPANLAELQTRAGDDYLFWRISMGKDGTAMVAWKGVLTDEQIWQVVAFIRTLK